MKTEKPFQQTIRNLPRAVYTCDEHGYINLFNKAAEELWGRKPTIGKELWCGSWKIFNTDGSSLPADKCPMARTLKTHRPVFGEEIVIQRPDGSFRFVNPYPTPLYNDKGEITGAISILIDITEMREKELAQGVKFQTQVEMAAESIVLMDLDANILSVNKSSCELLGFPKSEITGSNMKQVLPASYINRFVQQLSTLKTGHPVVEEKLMLKKDGSHFYSEISLQLISVDKVQATIRDITSQKNKEQALKDTIERYDYLAKATADTIWDWDIVNDHILFNEGITTMFGYADEQVNHEINWWKKCIHPEDLRRVCSTLEEAFTQQLQNFQLSYRFQCADGNFKYIYDRAFTIYDTDGYPLRMIGVMQDITCQRKEDVRISKAIIDAQENERYQIGIELHDNVNQILTGCLLNLSMIKHSDQQKSVEIAENSKGYILSAINELRKITHRLIPASPEHASLKDLFETLIHNMNINNQFNIDTDFDDCSGVKIDNEVQLNLYRILQEQLTNIIRYADASSIEISLHCGKEHIRMRVYDNGRGFEPTEVKQGIGLCNIRKRTEVLGGQCKLNTAVGKGCELVVEVPYHTAG